MYAFTVREDRTIRQVFSCSYKEYLTLRQGDPTLRWVSKSGFISNEADFLTYPSRYIYVDGTSLWDGYILSRATAATETVIPLSTTADLNGPDGGTLVVPDGINYFLISLLVAAGGDYTTAASPSINGGGGASVSNIGFLVYPGQVITLSGRQGGRTGTESVPAAGPITLTIDGKVVLSLSGGTSGTLITDVNPFLQTYPWNSVVAGAGGRWIKSPSRQLPKRGSTVYGSLPYHYNNDIVPPGGGGWESGKANPGLITGMLSSSLLSGYEIYSQNDPIYTNRTITPETDAGSTPVVQAMANTGFGVTASENANYVVVMGEAGNSGNDLSHGASVSLLCLKLTPGTSIGGFVGGPSALDTDNPLASQPPGKDLWLYAQKPSVNGVAQPIIPILYLDGGNGQPDLSGVNEYTAVQGGPSDGRWSLGMPSEGGYIISDGQSPRAGLPGSVCLLLCVPEEVIKSLQQQYVDPTTGKPPPIFDIDHYTPTIRDRSAEPNPSWTVDLNENDAGRKTIISPNWANYLEIVAVSSAGGAGSTTNSGGSGASFQGAIYSIPPVSLIRIRLGEPGKYNATSTCQQNGDLTSLSVNGTILFSLMGGAGAADDYYRVLPNFYPDWESPYNPLYRFSGQGGDWYTKLDGTPSTVSYNENRGVSLPTSAGGDPMKDGQAAVLTIRFHKNLPSQYPSAIPLNAQNIQNTLTRIDDPNPINSTQTVQGAGEYLYTVPAGCYGMCVDELVGAQGGGYADYYLSSYVFPAGTLRFGFVHGAAGGRITKSWVRVYPGQTVKVTLGAGGYGKSAIYSDTIWPTGVCAAPATPNQPQGTPSTVSLIDEDGVAHLEVGVDGGAGTPTICGISENYQSLGSDTETTTVWSRTPGSAIIYSSGTPSHDPTAIDYEDATNAWWATSYLVRSWTCKGVDGRATISFYPRVDPTQSSNGVDTGHPPKINTGLPAPFTQPVPFIYQLCEADRGSFMIDECVVPEGYYSLELVAAVAAGTTKGSPYNMGSAHFGGQLVWGSTSSGERISCTPGDKISFYNANRRDVTSNFFMLYTKADGTSNVLFEISPGTSSGDGAVVRTHPAFRSAKNYVSSGYFTQSQWGKISRSGLTCRNFLYNPWISTLDKGGDNDPSIPACLTHVFLIRNEAGAGASWGVPGYYLMNEYNVLSYNTSCGGMVMFHSDKLTDTSLDPMTTAVAW